MREWHEAATPEEAFHRQWVCQVLSTMRLEVLPGVNVADLFTKIPPSPTLTFTVTASPAQGPQATVETSRALRQYGVRVVPHLAARTIRDQDELDHLWEQLAAVGIDEVFVVGGDQKQPAGHFPDGLALLQALRALRHGPKRFGVPGYPEGHPSIPDDRLRTSLLTKQELADYAVLQISFDPDAVLTWLSQMRELGFRLPVYLCLPGTLRLDRLFRIGLRLGLGNSLRYLEKQRGLVGHLLAGGMRYDPWQLIGELARRPPTPQVGIVGIHWSTFNAVEGILRWVTAKQTELGCTVEGRD